MFFVRTTFLLFLAWAVPALASTDGVPGDAQCYSNFTTCNASLSTSGVFEQCQQEFTACLDRVAKSAGSETASSPRTHGGGHGGTTNSSPTPVSQTAPVPPPSAQGRAMISPQPTYQRPPRQDLDESQRCPSSSYPYVNEQGKVSCVTSGDIARGMNTTARGARENEMMGFFAELSQAKKE